MTWTRTKIAAGVAAVLLLEGAFAVMIFQQTTGNQTAGNQTIGNQATPEGESPAGAKIPATPVDMTASYTTPASSFDHITQFPAWTTVPRGLHVFGNVPFQIGGMICLWGGGNADQGLVFPEQCLGIVVNQKFDTLYVYHGAFYTSPTGTPVYELVFRYADGSSATNQILYGTDVLDWYTARGQPVAGPTGPNSKLAWHGDASANAPVQPVRFCLTAVKNRKPAVEVTAIDLFSCKSRTAPCILAFSTTPTGAKK
jgi:hypothetical protein